MTNAASLVGPGAAVQPGADPLGCGRHRDRPFNEAVRSGVGQPGDAAVVDRAELVAHVLGDGRDLQRDGRIDTALAGLPQPGGQHAERTRLGWCRRATTRPTPARTPTASAAGMLPVVRRRCGEQR
jgi:hypothetical protein